MLPNTSWKLIKETDALYMIRTAVVASAAFDSSSAEWLTRFTHPAMEFVYPIYRDREELLDRVIAKVNQA